VAAVLLCVVALSLIGQQDETDQLLESIEALQGGIEDFRCEFEGKVHVIDPEIRARMKLPIQGLRESYSGQFIWKSPGYAFVSSLHRKMNANRVIRFQLAIDPVAAKSTWHRRDNDAELGEGFIASTREMNTDHEGCIGGLVLIDALRRKAKDESYTSEVGMESYDGAPTTTVSFTMKSSNELASRYWIDMNHGGCIVRREDYGIGRKLAGRTDVKLQQFKIEQGDIWFPVSSSIIRYVTIRDNQPFISETPVATENIYIVQDTLIFNRRPPRTAFDIAFQPGTPIADSLKKLAYEFGQQQAPPRVTQSEAEEMLKEQLGKAAAQRAELIVSSPSGEPFPWTTVLTFLFGSTALISSILVFLQRRRG
jgi:hypothetical protein